MSLPQLPAELKLLISQYLPTISFINFVLTCRENYELCKAGLAIRKQYYFLNITRTDSLAFDLAADFIKNPILGEYVENLVIPAQLEGSWNGEPPEYFPGSDSEPLKSCIKYVKENLLETAPYWIPDLDELCEPFNAAIALILRKCTDLKVLQFNDDEGPPLPFFGLVALAYRNPGQSLSAPFQNLTYAAVGNHVDGLSCSFEYARLICAIPSLKGFAAAKMSGECPEIWLSEGLPKSNVTELAFDECFVESESLEDLLSDIKGLERFSMSFGNVSLGLNAQAVPKRITQALVNSAGHSLEALHFSDPDQISNEFIEHEIVLVSLREFEKLKVLHCDWATLSGYPDASVDEPATTEGFGSEDSFGGKCYDLTRRLPKSLEVLHLEYEPDEYDGDAWEALLLLIRNKETYVPNLKQVYIDDFMTREQKEVFFNLLEEKGLVYKPSIDYLDSAQNSLPRLLDAMNPDQ